jgi:NADPH:quinone reductase
MRKVQAEAVESISNYRIVDAAVPRPRPGEVLVKVAACGVGYVDALVALGRYQVKPSLPHTPGQDVSGWVEDAGDGVADLATGDRVMTTVRGGFAEFVIAPAASVVKIPSRMKCGAAAAFRMNYVTALHGLRDRGNVKSGETVVVLGAAGGLGAAAIQVAKVGGARVIAVASTEEKRAFCKSLGADETLSTTPEGWRDRLKAACGGAGPNVVFDPVCGPLFEPAFRALAWGGRHRILGFVGGPIPALPANLPLMKGAALIGVDVRQFGLFEPDRAAAHLTELLGWVSEERIAPPVGRTFGIEEFAHALEFALSGQGLGKTIVRMGENE